MKTLLKVFGVIVICMVLLLVTLRFTGLNPHGDIPGSRSYPGLWLSGNLVTIPVADWSFTDNIRTLKLQTNTWYLIPHSVTIWCIAYNRQLYAASFGAAVRSWPVVIFATEPLQATVGHAHLGQRFKLFGDHRFNGIGPQMRGWIVQQRRVVDL